MSLDVAYIKHIIAKAAYEDMELKTFGWKSHAHTLQPVLPESELETWQELLKVKLPADYAAYITKIGNGGAGPAYGLKVFNLNLDADLAENTVFSDEQKALFNEQAREWYELDNEGNYQVYCENTPEHQRLSFEEWDALLEERYEKVESVLFCKGQLFIANRGCDQDVYLLLNGSHCGWCHINSKEYDYSVGGNGIVLDCNCSSQTTPKRSIRWEEYKRYLMPFADYFMAYVKQCDALCSSISSEQCEQFHKERVVVREFLDVLASTETSSIDLNLDSNIDSHIDSSIDLKSDSNLDSNNNSSIYSNIKPIITPTLDSPIDGKLNSSLAPTFKPNTTLTFRPNIESSMVQVLQQLNPEMVSVKTRSLLTIKLQHWLHLTQPSLLRPGEPNIPDATYQHTSHTAALLEFYDQLLFQDRARCRFRERIALAENSRSQSTYPHPSLQQLEDSFYPERLQFLDK